MSDENILARIKGISVRLKKSKKGIPIVLGDMARVHEATAESVKVACRYQRLGFGLSDHVHTLTWGEFREHFEATSDELSRRLEFGTRALLP